MDEILRHKVSNERVLTFFGVEDGERGDVDDMMLHSIVRLSAKRAKKTSTAQMRKDWRRRADRAVPPPPPPLSPTPLPLPTPDLSCAPPTAAESPVSCRGRLGGAAPVNTLPPTPYPKLPHCPSLPAPRPRPPHTAHRTPHTAHRSPHLTPYAAPAHTRPPQATHHAPPRPPLALLRRRATPLSPRRAAAIEMAKRAEARRLAGSFSLAVNWNQPSIVKSPIAELYACGCASSPATRGWRCSARCCSRRSRRSGWRSSRSCCCRSSLSRASTWRGSSLPNRTTGSRRSCAAFRRAHRMPPAAAPRHRRPPPPCHSVPMPPVPSVPPPLSRVLAGS